MLALVCPSRFSPFVKTGSEAFVLGSVTLKTLPTANDKVNIVVGGYAKQCHDACVLIKDEEDPYGVHYIGQRMARLYMHTCVYMYVTARLLTVGRFVNWSARL